MEMRQLGKTGLSVAPIVIGGNVFGWTADEKTSFAVLDAFFDAGLNAIDTADVYSSWVPGNKGGDSEEIIGRWLKQARISRDQAVIITKVGSDMRRGKTLKASYILKAVEASLSRLQTDYIDLYLSHWPDADTPHEETLGAYAKLKAQGKVRAIGCSNYDAGLLQASFDAAEKAGLPRYDVLQPEYNLCERSSFEGRSPSFASRKILVSSPISASRPASSPANTAARPIPRAEPARAGFRNISTKTGCAFSPRSTRYLPRPAPSPRKSRLPGSCARRV